MADASDGNSSKDETTPTAAPEESMEGETTDPLANTEGGMNGTGGPSTPLGEPPESADGASNETGSEDPVLKESEEDALLAEDESENLGQAEDMSAHEPESKDMREEEDEVLQIEVPRKIAGDDETANSAISSQEADAEDMITSQQEESRDNSENTAQGPSTPQTPLEESSNAIGDDSAPQSDEVPEQNDPEVPDDAAQSDSIAVETEDTTDKDDERQESMDVDDNVGKVDGAGTDKPPVNTSDDVEMTEKEGSDVAEKETEAIEQDVEMLENNAKEDKTDEAQNLETDSTEAPEAQPEMQVTSNEPEGSATVEKTSTAEKEKPSETANDAKQEEEDDDVMVIEEEKQEPEAIVLDDDDDDDQTPASKQGDAQKADGASLATMDSANDTGLQIASVTGGTDASSLRIASVSGATQSKDSTSKNEPLKTKIKQEKITPPTTPTSSGPTTRKSAQGGSSTPQSKKSSKMQSCIVCGKVGRCKYNIVRNGDIKHLCDDVCFKKFRSNPTMFLKNTSQQKSSQPSTRSQTGASKSVQPAQKSSPQSEYRTCTVCQLMNINTQKPFLKWMSNDFCSEPCLAKFQGNLSSSCTYCTTYIPRNARPANCLQVGTEFKSFCSQKCNAEFKKRLRLCAFCQKDLSTVKSSDTVSVQVDANKHRDFCSRSCRKKYDEKNSDVEILGMESTGKKSMSYKCAVCSKVVPSKHNVKLNGVMNRLCSDPCLSAFQYANKLGMNTCDNCGGLCPAEEVASHFIQFEGQQKRFCKDTCVNTFRTKHRKIVPCGWCGSRKTNFDMIERVDSNNKYQLFCSLNCLSLYRVNLQAKSNQAVSCDHCRKFVPAQYHLTMSDASVRNFCSYNCVMSFQSQFTANSKNSSQPTIHSQQRVQLQTKPTTRSGAANSQASQGKNQAQSQNSFPVISNVVSLAPQGQKQQTVNIKSNTPVPVVVGKQSVSTGTQQQIIIQPPPPKQMKNKSLLCKPFVQTKATSCRPHTITKEVQTDEHQGKPVLIPVPIPIYIPCPLAMYAAPTPQMVPIPIPIPVPVFIPTAKKSADKILKHIKEIQEKIPSDPLEAELLMMAEAVATGNGDSDSDSEKSEAEPLPTFTNDKDESGEVEPEIEQTPPGGEEDLVQMALRMAEEITGPVLDLETSVEPVPVNTEPPPPRTPPEPPKPTMVEDEDDEYVPPRETRSRRGKRGSRGRGGRQAKRIKVEVPEPEPIPEPSPPPIMPAQPPPDANMHLKYTYGVNAWRHWVIHKNTLLEKVSKRGSGKLKLFKTDLLQCTADELNYTLCLFVKEVRKPNGEEYSPDSIYYLCLGIQQYLYENSRIDNIFTDLYYEKFTECLNDVLAKYEPKVNTSGQMLCRIEEEHIWECKQLGAHSPYVLLNTLIYFNTKHFMLKSADQHMKLSFAHILKHWKKGGPGAKVVSGQGRSVSLRYYCVNPNTQNAANKKSKEMVPVYETSENLENPLRCPVKLYEFYLSKCPESIKNRNDLFYLVPERSCVPDSPVWYSTQSIGQDSMSKMLNRILLIREIQEAHIHAEPIYV